MAKYLVVGNGKNRKSGEPFSKCVRIYLSQDGDEYTAKDKFHYENDKYPVGTILDIDSVVKVGVVSK